MNDITITSNRHHREAVCLADLPESAAAEFDYIDEDETYSPRFVKYRDSWYDINEFLHPPTDGNCKAFGEWNGYSPDSFFSGIVVRYPHMNEGDYDVVQVGRYCC